MTLVIKAIRLYCSLSYKKQNKDYIVVISEINDKNHSRGSFNRGLVPH